VCRYAGATSAIPAASSSSVAPPLEPWEWSQWHTAVAIRSPVTS
jgi:hypothetical protein